MGIGQALTEGTQFDEDGRDTVVSRKLEQERDSLAFFWRMSLLGQAGLQFVETVV